MSKQLRRVAQVNPPVPELRGLGDDEVTFLPLEAVWPDGRRRYEFTKPANTAGYTVLRRGDVVMPKITPTFEAGRVFVADDLPTAAGLATTEVHVLRPRGIDPRYLAYFLRTQPVLSEGETVLQGVGNLRRVTAEWVSTLTIPVDNESDQARIADYLDRETATIDALIEKQQRMLELLHQRATAVTSQLVWAAQETESAVHGGLPEAPASWNVVRNKDLWRESKTVSVFGDEEPLSVSHITGVTRRSEKNVTMIEAESYAGYRIVEPGDLVINTMWAWMGALGVSELNGIVSPAYGVYRTTHPDLMDCRFFNRLYRTPEYVRYMESWSRGLWSSRLRLYPEVFLSLPVPVPPLEEQREIADYLDAETAKIDALISKAERFIELAQERRAALITAAVTGQIEIPAED
ncbi:restriction endonuclease subunit S [Micrococcus luteus]|nr:restriction endonuclease subunit S [Micrococcus luteus]